MAKATTAAMEAEVNQDELRAQSAKAAASIRDEEREEIFIPRAVGNEEPNLFVSVNGVNYLLPKGKSSMVPKSIAAEVRRSWQAQQKLDETIDTLKEAAKQPT